MGTLSLSLVRYAPIVAQRQFRKTGTLGWVIFLHIGFLLLLKNGLDHQTKKVVPRYAAPKAIFATFITLDTAPAPVLQKHQITQPKAVPIVKRTPKPTPVPTIKPTASSTPAPPVVPKPSERAISAPTAANPPPSQAEHSLPTPPIQSSQKTESTPSHSTQPKNISSGVEYIEKPNADYPRMSRSMEEEGTVILRILVNEQGHPERVDIQTSSGFERLDEAARKAALKAVFKPYIEEGKPISVYVHSPIAFKLN